ncbi:MAG TPA: transcriptional regulator [Chloroflexi bacterium]|nr:transcriptional regulator [Chloroflexota bacterium]
MSDGHQELKGAGHVLALSAFDGRETILENLKAIGRAVVESFGGHACEVLIHDLSDLEHSIIWVEGNVTGRHVGGSMTDLGLELVRGEKFEDLFNYTTYTDDGRVLKSSSIFLRDAAGQTWGAFCLNLDVTPYHTIVHQLKKSILREGESGVTETFSDDVEITVRNLLAEAAFECGKPLHALHKSDRLAVIQILDRKGVFQVKRAVPILAKYLGVSRYTVYNDLNAVRNEAAGSSEEDA